MAELAGYHPEHLRRLAREGKVKALPVEGRVWLFHAGDVMDHKTVMARLAEQKHTSHPHLKPPAPPFWRAKWPMTGYTQDMIPAVRFCAGDPVGNQAQPAADDEMIVVVNNGGGKIWIYLDDVVEIGDKETAR
jgi:hypothetical protein